MRQPTARSLVLAIALASAPTLTALTREARADSESDGKDLFSRGRELRTAGDCAGAVEKFRKAYQLLPAGLGSLRNIAECEEQEGLWASARRDWLDLKRAVLSSKDTTKYDGWDADADAAASRLAPKVAKLTISIARKTQEGVEEPLDAKAKVTVFVNDDLLDARLLGTELDRDPGSYAVRVEGGKAKVAQSVTLKSGESKRVSLVVELDVPKGVAATDGAGEEHADVSSDLYVTARPVEDHTARSVGWVAIGIGGASAIGMLASLAVRQSALRNVESKCPEYASKACGSNVSADASRGRTASILVDVFGAVTLVGVGVGLALVLANPSAPAENTTKPVRSAIQVTPLAGASFAGAALSGEF